MDRQGVDADVIESVGVDWIRPEDGGGFDRTIDQEFTCDFALNKATPSLSRSSSDGKNLWLAPPRRMEICPKWEVVEVPVYGLHLLGVGNEKPEALFKSSSMADKFKT